MKMIKAVLAFSALMVTVSIVILLWRMRGVLSWKRSLRKEFKELIESALGAPAARRRAKEVVIEVCNRVWRETTPDLSELLNLRGYIRSIAGCFHPQAEKPEMCLTTGRFIHAARDMAGRLELILQRPGFNMLRRVRIRHIRKSFEWYRRIRQNWIFNRVCHYQNIFSRIYRIHRVLLPDPFVWLAFFSNRLTILLTTRYLMLDVYLFIGKLAIDAYDNESEKSTLRFYQEAELEKTFRALNAAEAAGPSQSDPQLKKIRDQLVGIGPLFFNTPGLGDLQAAIETAAKRIAGRYFPDSEKPQEEAALGPLLGRTHVWLRRMCETEKLPVLKRFHQVRLGSLYDMKSIADIMLSKRVLKVAMRTRELYFWVKWPLRVYRWIKRTSPLNISTTLGWLLLKKSFVNLALRYMFDSACREIDMVYQQSRLAH